MGHSRLGGASWRSGHVRNAPLATVGPKKAACRDGPMSAFCTAENPPRSTVAFLSFPTSGMISLEGAHAITSTPRYTDE